MINMHFAKNAEIEKNAKLQHVLLWPSNHRLASQHVKWIIPIKVLTEENGCE